MHKLRQKNLTSVRRTRKFQREIAVTDEERNLVEEH